MIKIFDLRDSPWVDGPGRTVLETAEALDGTHYSVIVGGFCSGNFDDNIYLREARRRSLGFHPIVEKRALDPGIFRQTLAAIREHGADIVHTHDFRSNLVGLYCARREGIPAISTCHGWITNDMKGRIYKRIDIKLLSRFDKVVAVSGRIRTQLVANGIPANKIEVIANALSLKNFEPEPGNHRFRSELGIAETTQLLLNIGRLSPEKGQALLLKAIAKVRVENPDIRLVLVGIGPEEASLRQSASALGLDDIVIFSGYRSEMRDVYNSADVVIQSSFTEGMPNVILESLAMQTPVIATDVGGTAEIVEHGVSGYLVAPGSEPLLVEGVRDFLRNKRSHEDMAQRGRDTVVENYNHEKRVSLLEQLYSSVAAHGPR